jgi:hypothetical protein
MIGAGYAKVKEEGMGGKIYLKTRREGSHLRTASFKMGDDI